MFDDYAAPGVVFNVLGPLEMRGRAGAADLCGKPAMLRVEVRWTKPGTVTRKMPDVVVRVQPATSSCKASAASVS